MSKENEKEIKQLQERLKFHSDNYFSLKDEELYQEYKKGNLILDQDQLDYLMCQALCSMPEYASYIALDDEWRLLFTLNNIFNTKNAIEPQLEMIALVVEKRNILDGNNNWCSSVIYLFELMMRKNVENIHADLARIKQLREPVVQPVPLIASAKKSKQLLFLSTQSANECEDKDEKCCNWVLRDFTAMIF